MLAYTLTKDDFSAFMTHLKITSNRRKGLVAILFLLVGMVVVPAVLMLSATTSRFTPTWQFWPLLIGPILFVPYAAHIFFRMRHFYPFTNTTHF